MAAGTDEPTPRHPAHGLLDTVAATIWSGRLSPPDGRLRLPTGPVRPRRGRLVGGVCAGLARSLGWNVWFIRALLLIINGPLYILLWVLMPPEGPDGRATDTRGRDVVVWLALLGLGAGTAAVTAAQLASTGVPTGPAIVVGVAVGTALPVLSWSPLLAWRILAVAELLGLAGFALWTDGVVLRLWPWPIPGLVLLALVLFLVALRYERRIAVCAGAVTIVADVAVAPALTAVPLYAPPLLALVMAAALVLGDSIRTRRHVERRLAQETDRRRQDLARHAVLEERARIARELHDVVGHHMSMIAIQAEAAAYKVPDLPEPLRVPLTVINQAARAALAETRRIVGLLRVDDADGSAHEDAEPGAEMCPPPGLDGLDDLIERARRSGIDVSASVLGVPVPLPIAVDVSAYRIVQEALTNVAHHAPGASAEVVIGYHRTSLAVRITDDGPVQGHRSTTGGGGHGLVGMRERVAMLGGRLSVGPADAGGFVVSAQLPIGAQDGH
jgi:signal transduction histidine kinase/phage shock protein PspC (stress-responsive transcriptional regulator)